jgi:hypothetical protein
MGDAKVWKKASFVKSHLTSIKNYRKDWGPRNNDPADWIVIEVELMPRFTYPASTFS